MGRSFSKPVEISNQVAGGVKNGLWQRVRLYKDSNPIFQHGNGIEDYAAGKGRLWGFDLHSNGGGYTRKPYEAACACLTPHFPFDSGRFGMKFAPSP